MRKLKADETRTANATGTEKAEPGKKARIAPQRAHVAPKAAKSGKKATPEKKPGRSARKAGVARDGSKAAKVLDLLKRRDGATLGELMKATGWQSHSVRGFLSGTVRKKLNLSIASTKSEKGERTYSVEA